MAREVKINFREAEVEKLIEWLEAYRITNEGFLDQETEEGLYRMKYKLEKSLKLNKWKLRQMCIDHDWFTGGTNEQYQKMFDLADIGDIDGVIYSIWLCSDDVDINDIEVAVKELAE